MYNTILKELILYSDLKDINIEGLAKSNGIILDDISMISINDYIFLCKALELAPYLPFLSIEEGVKF